MSGIISKRTQRSNPSHETPGGSRMNRRARIHVLSAMTIVRACAGLSGAPAETFGKGVPLKTVTPLDQVVKTPAQFEGKTVHLEGVVTAVCSEMGCWMALGTKDAPDASTILVKVEDGVIVFPITAKGKRAAAQGVI